MRSPAVRPFTSNDTLPRPEKLAAGGFKESPRLPEPPVKSEGAQKLKPSDRVAAEGEARSMSAAGTSARSGVRSGNADAPPARDPASSRARSSDGRAAKVPARYDYDLQSVREEIVSNVEEVQKFNEQLEASEEEAHLINDVKQAADPLGRTVRIARKIDPGQALGLVTSIVEVVREPLVILDNALCICKANRAFYRTFGYQERDAEGHSIYDLAQESWDIPALRGLLEKVLRDNRAYEEVEVEVESLHVERKTLRLNVRRLSGGDMILMSIRDVTPRRRTEVELHRVQDELRQGQKMEVVGRLAGGVAHDFNNILTGILGFSELLLGTLKRGTDAYHHAAEIKGASERAAALTQQLLAFSRRQVLRPQIVSLNTVIQGLNEMLHRLIGDNIELDHTLAEDLGAVRADPGQISQVILNLALNARDAMPQGGKLSIRTDNIDIQEKTVPIRGLAAGSYVSLTVTDSGTGMDIETQQHIFEPFYTTKPQGSGTGLGLATVFGIVEQSGGHIEFASELDCGTTFWVDFPRVEGKPSTEAHDERVVMLKGDETILLVEDDDLVRELVSLVLSRLGYKVLEAAQASQGLVVCQSYASQIHLILTDLLMPGGMDGRQLVTETIRIRPEMRALLMSGYTTDALVLYGVGEGAAFLQKPFTQQQLANKVRDVLDGSYRATVANSELN